MKHEFPTEWYRLQTVAAADGTHTQGVALVRGRFPVLFQRSPITIGAVELFGVPAAGRKPTKLPALAKPDATPVALADGAAIGGLLHQLGPAQIPVADADSAATWQRTVPAADLPASLAQLDDLILLVHYSIRPQP